MNIPFSAYTSACIESTNEEFDIILNLYPNVESFKERALMKYFLYLKQEEKTIKLFETFSIPILTEYIQFAKRHDMYKLLFYFSTKEPVLFYSSLPHSNANFFKKLYFELLF